MKRVFIFILSYMHLSTSQAVDVVGPLIINNTHHVGVVGNFNQSSYNKLKKLYGENKGVVLIVHANSTGGNAQNVLEIMDLIHQHNNTYFYISEDNICGSTCAFAAISSKGVYGNLKFHGVRIYRHRERTTYMDNKTNTQILDRLHSYGIDPDLANKMVGRNIISVDYP